jgi:hypothetical protein
VTALALDDLSVALGGNRVVDGLAAGVEEGEWFV